MVWRLLGFELRVAVTRPRHERVDRHFGEAALPEGKCGPCPFFALHPGIYLLTKENHGTHSDGVDEKCLAEEFWRDSFSLLVRRFTGRLY